MGGIYDELRVALHTIWLRRWLALGVAWAIAVVGWFVVAQIPNTYESRARVFVQLTSILPDQPLADQARAVDTVRQTLTSSVNLQKVVRGTDLANQVSSDADVVGMAAGLQKSIKVVAAQDNLFEISATAGNPKVAKQVVQKLIDIFVEQNLAGDRNQNTQQQRFLDGQLASLQKRLQDAEAKRSEFETRYLGSLPGSGSMADRMSAARDQMSQVDGDLAAAQSSLAAVNGQMAGTAPTVPGVGASGMGPARARLALIQGQLADARGKGYTDAHPDVIALKAQLAQAQAAARSEPLTGGAGGTPNPLYLSFKSMQADKQAQVAALQMRRAQLQGQIDAITAKLAEDPAAAAEQSQIQRDYQVLKDQYDKLLGDREAVKLQGSAQTQTDQVKFSVIDPPSGSSTPASPNRPLLLTGVLILGLGAGVGAAFVLGQLLTSFPTATRLEKATGLPVIGSVGEMVSAAERALRRQRLMYFAGGAGGLALAWVALLGVEMLQRGLAA